MKKAIKGLTGFLAVLLGISANNVEAAKVTEKVKPDIEAIVNAEPNEATIRDNIYAFRAAPAKAGKSTEISVFDYLFDKKDPITKIVLYENGQKIAEGETYLTKEVTKNEAGNHVYNAEIFFKSGDKINTKDLKVSFKGEPIDFAPIERWFYATEKAGKAAKVMVEGYDIGDNKGIEKIVLYENGQKIAEEKGDRMYNTIERPAGKFKYHAEIIDKGGNVTKTKEKEVSFLGKAFEPDINWFYASPKEKAGKSVRIFAEANDKKNLDAKSGIEKLILYENGKQIYETRKENILGQKTIFEMITKDSPGIFRYQVEAINKNGEKARSGELTVNFEGRDLPPKVIDFSARLDKKDGYKATIGVWADDEANQRDDAGIKEILLYENNKLIHSESGKDFFGSKRKNFYKEIVHHNPGIYKYHAEVINNGGIKATTNPVELKFF